MNQLLPASTTRREQCTAEYGLRHATLSEVRSKTPLIHDFW
ncbi:hypothetical protein [Anabaena catenula]|nr:hypothetical protein [Anabaena catenula]